MIVLEVRALPAAPLLDALLAELSAEQLVDGAVAGDGWCARFVPLPPARLGAMQIPALRVEIDGPHAEVAAAVVRRAATRGGG